MNPADQSSAVHPSPTLTSALMRGLCQQIEHNLSELAWLTAGQPETLPPGSIEALLHLASTIYEIEQQIRD